VWVPAVKEQPPFGVRVLFDFESGRYDGWTAQGNAWGNGPANGAVTGQAVVGGYGGRFFATSMRGGDKATGTLLSDPFVIDGNRITLRVGGGVGDDLRIELRVDGQMVRRAVASQPVGERLIEVSWDVSELRDRTAQLAADRRRTTAPRSSPSRRARLRRRRRRPRPIRTPGGTPKAPSSRRTCGPITPSTSTASRCATGSSCSRWSTSRTTPARPSAIRS
jgi:hypothetical protein